MNVLSLFDGISCGQIALKRSEILYDKYFASEIDKWAIEVTQKNFPNTVQLGDINNWKQWKLPKIDVLMGGSPCQGFSSAGNGLNFEDPRSKLFFVFVDILKELKNKNPELKFLFENVKMKKEWENIISEFLCVKPIEINSSLVSAQNRIRLYWTNIPNISQPEDKHIFIKDIMEQIDESKLYDLIYTKIYNNKKGNILKLGNIYPSFGQNGNIYDINGKSPAIMAGIGIKGSGIGSSNSPKVYVYDKKWRRLTTLECERLQTITDNYTSCINSTNRYKLIGNAWTVDVIVHILKNIKTT